MLTKLQLVAKVKDFRTWAKNDAKRFVIKTHKGEEKDSVADYFQRCIAVYNEDRLVKQFNYTPDQVVSVLEFYNTAFWRAYEFYNSKVQKIKRVVDDYKLIFNEASEVANKVDVKDIKDGFPCGSAHLYLAETKTPLARALAYLSDSKTDSYKYRLPIKMPCYGQCITFDERICKEVQKFLDTKGLKTYIYSWID